jgi:hypothetical protein
MKNWTNFFPIIFLDVLIRFSFRLGKSIPCVFTKRGAWLTNRVTRLGEYSRFGRLFFLGSFWKLPKERKFLGYFFPVEKSVIWTKKCWATLWLILSQTHLVTLCATSLGRVSRVTNCFVGMRCVGWWCRSDFYWNRKCKYLHIFWFEDFFIFRCRGGSTSWSEVAHRFQP